MLHAIHKRMTANQIKVFATPEAYEYLQNITEGQSVPMMKVISELTSDNYERSAVAGFGTSPLMTVKTFPEASDEIIILLYKTRVNLNPEPGVIVGAQLFSESNEYRKNFDLYLKTAIPVNFS